MGGTLALDLKVKVNMVNPGVLPKELQRMSTAFESLDKRTNMLNRTTTTYDRTNKGVQKTVVNRSIPATKRFSFEFLGLMFAGMAVQRMFQGLLQPALNTAGVFETISAIMEILFLPVAIKVEGILVDILDAVTKLNEEEKELIGNTAVLGLTFGFALLFIGQAQLGLQALSGVMKNPILLGGIAKLTKAWAKFVKFSGGVGRAFGLIGLAISLLAIAFSTNGDKIIEALEGLLTSIEKINKGIVESFDGAIEIIDGIMTLDMEKVMSGFEKIVSSSVDKVIGLFFDLPISILDVLQEIRTGIVKWVTDLPGFIIRLAGKVAEAFLNIIPGESAIAGRVDGFVNAILGALRPLKPFFDFLLDPFKFGKGFDLGSLSGLIPGLADGGIVTRPTLAMIGESGPEAVIPLDGRGGGIGGGGTIFATFNINARIENDVDVRNLAKQINDELVNEQRRRGFIT